jgi:hypothetical protein
MAVGPIMLPDGNKLKKLETVCVMELFLGRN